MEEGKRHNGRRRERMTQREPACLFLLALNLVGQRTAKTLQLDLHVSFVCLKRKVVVSLIEFRVIVEVQYLALGLPCLFASVFNFYLFPVAHVSK